MLKRSCYEKQITWEHLTHLNHKISPLSKCTELGSPKLIFGATVEGAACPGMLEPVLARVAILLSTIADTMEVIWSMVIAGWDSVCSSSTISLESGAVNSTGSSGWSVKSTMGVAAAERVRVEAVFAHFARPAANSWHSVCFDLGPWGAKLAPVGCLGQRGSSDGREVEGLPMWVWCSRS